MLRRTLPLALLLVFAGSQAAPLWSAPLAAQVPVASSQKQKSGKLVGSFDKAEMEAMVKELSLVIPENPGLQYPIDCDFVETTKVNAYATTEDLGEGKKPQAVMRILTGILAFIDKCCADNVVVGLDPEDPSKKITLHEGDQRRLLRAVVAHEMGHLNKGHVIEGRVKGRDMAVIYTREREQEADMVGAAALQRAGYSRRDAEQMLMMLEVTDGGGSVAENLLGDHADGKRRALSVAEDPRVLRALVEYDLGLAFSEVRSFSQATAAFDRAAQREPKLKEAYINAAQTSASFYYEQIGESIRKDWFRPDFGPLLKSPVFESRDGKFTDGDFKRYADAERHATIALQKAPDDMRALEIAGLVGVMDPKGEAAHISNGIANLQKALAMAMDPADRLRVANNLALGYQRSGDVAKGTDALVVAFRETKGYNAAGAYNLGFAPLPKSKATDATLVADRMFKYLTSTPKSAPGYAKIAANYNTLTSSFGIAKQEVPKSGPLLALCQVYSIVDGGQEINLFDHYEDVSKKLGAGTVELGIAGSGDDRIKPGQAVGIFAVKYRDGQVSAIFQTRDEKELARITSYSPGAYLELRPIDVNAGQTFRVTVGMKESELYAHAPKDTSADVRLFRVGQLEEWSYFPFLNFGVQIKNGVVAGITATPVAATP